MLERECSGSCAGGAGARIERHAAGVVQESELSCAAEWRTAASAKGVRYESGGRSCVRVAGAGGGVPGITQDSELSGAAQ